ncbi:hypothetical protein [Spirosoma linguale]|uniref:Uncharacterized protein n=1 Tax=Spirosoma linguale (strain ATCC 33905 / DSM 74 / LMG 10896 / Claus 1) TaxID=504472 RepID=D2QV05_SPILD|nr:hypothetical protein Slin_6681 [Spirosoma linguale DSM 74]
MARPVNFRQYFTTEYPELDTSKIDILALLNNVELAYNDHRDTEQRSVDISESSAGELTAQSISWRNVLYINQYQLWKTLGWTSLAALGIDYKTWVSLAAVLVLLKDFNGIRTHSFSSLESNVLYGIYRTGHYDEPYFTLDQLYQTYNSLFEAQIKMEIMQCILAELESLSIIEKEGLGYVVREQINLDRRSVRFSE